MIVDIPDDHPIKLNFIVKEYLGSEIYRIIDGQVSEETFTNESDIAEGMIVSVYDGQATIKKNEYGKFYWTSGRLQGPLEFAQDDRLCWVSVGIINNRAIANLSKSSK